MKKILYGLFFAGITLSMLTACASAPKTVVDGNEMGVNVKSNFQHIDWMTMDISDDFITYDIDILSPEGKLMLQDISEEGAKSLALSQAIKANKCDAIFQPRITTVRGNKNEILRVTVYGRPAKYKKRID